MDGPQGDLRGLVPENVISLPLQLEAGGADRVHDAAGVVVEQELALVGHAGDAAAHHRQQFFRQDIGKGEHLFAFHIENDAVA